MCLEHTDVDLNWADFMDQTPLHVAAARGSANACKYLLENGANPNPVDITLNTPLDLAVAYLQPETAKIITANGGIASAASSHVVGLLNTCCSEGNVKEVKRLINEGVPVNSADYDQRTPLHLAASEGFLEVVKALVEAGAELDSVDRWMGSALSDAIDNGHLEVAEYLMHAGANIDAGGQGDVILTNFMKECQKGNIEKVKKLLETNYAKPEWVDQHGRSALHIAASEGHMVIVKLLVELGAEINSRDKWNMTATDAAERGGFDTIAEFLKDQGGASSTSTAGVVPKICKAVFKDDLERLTKICKDENADLNACDYDRRTALHASAAKGKLSFVEVLVENGAVVNAQDRWGNTPLGDAVENGHDEIASYLRRHGANFNTKELGGIEGRMCAAASAGRLSEIKQMVAEGANVNVSDYDKRTPLHLAASENFLEIVKFLVSCGAEINAEDRWGGTPYSDAVRNCHSGPAGILEAAGGVMGMLGGDLHWRVNPADIHYQKLEAEGFQGATWRAEWCGLIVAVKKLKVVKDNETLDPATWKLFANEIDLLSRLRHPNLVMFLGACIDVDRPMLIEEYMGGGSVQALLDKNSKKVVKISPAKVLKYASDVALGINYLHKHSPQVIHRDLSPANLLLTANKDTCKVCDFGFGKIVQGPGDQTDHYKMTGGLGSLRYMAPEVLMHKPYNEKVDVYSLGMCVYYMSTGYRPYGADKNPIEVAKNAAANPSFRPNTDGVPPPIRDLMAACWAHDPDKRPSMQEVCSKLDQLRQGNNKSCSIQ
ncbi:TKL protein kinase [Sphaeroforma arctica JP610]|uniref:TKL protein kinase n=1 Tax=Sphaeroforma arctica JP610 TaxID=667725 RepID=A0A0L0FF51_9EUKA|nr:TKL protein kinase [Sphaeroforma arctica JP610]KNC75385.1 TKL protein kinase [Sphaeroforma arctica JP610]|eukprot:XP_014149287.1 TKL protein kinase [Sphaeroforma arctica JP610]